MSDSEGAAPRPASAAAAPPRPQQPRRLVEAIGNTPLIEVVDGVPDGVRVFAKLESVNPGGSIKDRPVKRMLAKAIEAGEFMGRRRLLDSSSGNAGIAYAMLGAAFEVPVTLVVPGNASAERLGRIRAHGAELILTDPVEGYDHALREVKRIAAEQPDLYFHCDQYANENNWLAHYETTGVELIEQVKAETGRLPAAFVAGVGTGGTITGIGRRLKQADRGVHVACIVPDVFPGIEGLKPLGAPGDIVPDILDASVIDERIPVQMEDALPACRALARRGIFVGPSSGAYLHAALKLAATGEYPVVATILNDTGERYVSTGMWSHDECHQT